MRAVFIFALFLFLEFVLIAAPPSKKFRFENFCTNHFITKHEENLNHKYLNNKIFAPSNPKNNPMVMGDTANVYIELNGPAKLEINDLGQYQLIYGNNGTTVAGNVTITDSIPMVFRPLAVDNPNCSINFQTITCNMGDLPPGTEDTILIDFVTGPFPFMIDSSFISTAQIKTDSLETSSLDNMDSLSILITVLNFASINGVVWQDRNRDGRVDAMESGMEAVEIHLSGTDLTGATVNLIDTTDITGNYTFDSLYPGDYNIEEIQPVGWLSNGYPKLGLIEKTTNIPLDTLINQGMIDSLNGNEAFLSIALEGGYRAFNYNFGEDLGSIGNRVWVDQNIDGIQDIAEEGIEGISVSLYKNANDSLMGTTSTDSLGDYLFEHLFANNYYLIFDKNTLPDSINRISAQQVPTGHFSTNSDANPSDGKTPLISLATGQDDLSWDMGIYGILSIGNYIWLDTNKDGIQDGTDMPIEGLNVTIFNNLGDSITTVQTNSSGHYSFHSDTLAMEGSGIDTLLYPNVNYYIIVGLDTQFNKDFSLLYDSLILTTDSIGLATLDSDGTLAINRDPDFDGYPFIAITTPAFGEIDTTFDFGFQPVVFDWGDLPDTSASTNQEDYLTLKSNDGPRHVIISGLTLGASIDDESDGQPSTNANGDGGDDDGSSIMASLDISPNGTIRLPFSYTNTTDSTAYLKVWIDWNGDGKFKTIGEEALSINDELNPFPSFIEINVPATAKNHCPLGLRMRLSLLPIDSPYGLLPSGEVEDYLIKVKCPKVCFPVIQDLKKG